MIRRLQRLFVRSRRAAGRDAAVLFVLHCSPFSEHPGGTELWVCDLVRGLSLPHALIAYPEGATLVVHETRDGVIVREPTRRYATGKHAQWYCVDHKGMRRAFDRVLADFPVALVHLHHLLQLPLSLGRVFKRRDVPYVFTSHDYFAICPNFVLLDYANNRPCDCSPERRARCLQDISEEHGTPGLNATYAREHARRLPTFLSEAAALSVPSEVAKALLAKHNPLLARAVVIEHGYDAPKIAVEPRTQGPLRVGIVGHVFRVAKGRKHYERLIPLLQGLPIAWHFFGMTTRSGFVEALTSAAPGATLVWHGAYERGTLPQRLADAQIDVCLSLQPWHETFSFTLSEAAGALVPSIVLPYGAPAARVSRDGLGIVAADLDEVRALLVRFAGDRSALDALQRPLGSFVHRSVAESCNDHRALYATCGFTENP